MWSRRNSSQTQRATCSWVTQNSGAQKAPLCCTKSWMPAVTRQCVNISSRWTRPLLFCMLGTCWRHCWPTGQLILPSEKKTWSWVELLTWPTYWTCSCSSRRDPCGRRWEVKKYIYKRAVQYDNINPMDTIKSLWFHLMVYRLFRGVTKGIVYGNTFL